MSKDEISRPDPMLFAEDSLANRLVKRESSKPKTTPAISGQKCLGLSGNAGPLGLLEKTLLGSSDWAWTKYSLTWKAKATPQGRLIYQLARQEPRTSADDSGLLHTPTAKANQMAPSMATRDSGSWGSTLWPTPTASDHKGSGGTVLADSQREGEGRRRVSGSGKNKSTDGKGSSVKSGGHGQAVADSDIDDGRRGCGAKSSGRESRMEHWSGGECGRSEEWWEVEPEVGRLVDGLPNRVPQLRALGNSIVPQIAQKIGQAIKETYNALD